MDFTLKVDPVYFSGLVYCTFLYILSCHRLLLKNRYTFHCLKVNFVLANSFRFMYILFSPLHMMLYMIFCLRHLGISTEMRYARKLNKKNCSFLLTLVCKDSYVEKRTINFFRDITKLETT